MRRRVPLRRTLRAPVLTLRRPHLPFRPRPLGAVFLLLRTNILSRTDIFLAEALSLPPCLTEIPRTLSFRTVLRVTVVTVSWRRTDFEFVQLVPFRIGTITIRNGKQFANPATNIKWLWIVHDGIMTQSGSCIQY